jgi:O-antigen chain-terminating methyltransferase
MTTDDFYLRFENKFSGSKELIRERQTPYLSIIQPLKTVHAPPKAVDLGSGRGEWLELLSENGWIPVGVDTNAAMRESCLALGFTVVAGDAVQYVSELPNESVSLITGFHIAEHLPFGGLLNLGREAYRALKPGGILILETPNAENLIVGTCTFFSDPTHLKPLPPGLLKFLVEDAGFCRASIARLNGPKTPEGDRPWPGPSLADVFYRTSWDVSVICQKSAERRILDLFTGFDPDDDN